MRRTVLGYGVRVVCCSACFILPTAGYPQEAAGSITCGGTYVIAGGDSLSSVAQRVYGDPKRYDVLFAANRDKIGDDPGNVALGTSILLPCLDASGQPMILEATAPTETAMEEAITSEGPLGPAELDTLFGPVALFPDPLLTQVLMAATYPLDVMKADRVIKANPDLSDKDLANILAVEPWDTSVQQLAAGFPELVTRMADHIDWTEQAGDAFLAQTEDVLASIQRLRAKAEENGYLTDNDAQTIAQVDGYISIAPASPEVIYVPTYDSKVIYTTPMPSSAAYNQYYYGYDNNDWSDAVAAGAIIFGGALILDEIFDDNDDIGDWWNNGNSIDWDRGDININRGDIDIDRGDISIGGGNVSIGGGNVSIGDGNRLDGVSRPSRPADRPSRIGGAEDAALAGRPDRTFAPDQASRDVARQKIESRKATNPGVADLPATRPSAKVPASRTPTATAPKVRAPSASRPAAASRPTQVAKPAVTRRPDPTVSYRSPPKTAFQPSGGARASAGASRGRASSGGGRRR
jgi:hypothetical protein